MRLKSDSSHNYANPMYLDTEGYNTLRSPSAVDPGTKKLAYPLQDIIFEVYADGKAPVTTSMFSSNNSKTLNGKKYYNGNVAATFKTKDKVSGTENTYFSIDNKAFAEFEDTLKFTGDGEKVLKFYSTDKVGNREDIIEKTFTVDNTPPVSTFEFDGVLNEKFVNAQTKIKLSAKDNLIGIKTIYYKINGGETKTYTAPIAAKWLQIDNGIIKFWAVDHLNNTEEAKVIGGKNNPFAKPASNVFEFYMDKEPPTMAVAFEGQHSKGKYTYVSNKTKLKVSANDSKSGVEKVHYSINNQNVDKQYDEFIEFTDEGIAYVRVNATDYVENTSETLVKTYFVDNSAPKTTISFASPKHKVKDTLFITKNTKINLKSADNASGVESIFYSLNGNPKVKFEDRFCSDKEGINKVEFWSFDNVGNEEKKGSFEFFVDNMPPEIYHHYSTTPIGSKKIREEVYTIYPTDVKLYVASTDEDSGAENVTYKVNGGTVKNMNPISGFTPGNYRVEVFARDLLGNATSTIIKFAIED